MHVYVHTPFCDSICYYCDFCRYKSEDRIKKQWKDVLIQEIQEEDIHSISTLYFGGGTPSSLDIESFKEISSLFLPYLKKEYEWTVECNPDSVTMEKLKLYKQLGVNRISLGVQTFNDEHLKAIGRNHSIKDIYKAIEMIRSIGIENISIDLIYGLPNQTLEDIQYNLDCFLQLNLPHLSIYSLQIEENSIFGKRHIEPCDEDLEADMYECIKDILTEHGYIHYEISSYCKETYESKHNLSYWSDCDFVGLGCGASGKENGIRYDHTRNLMDYIKEKNHKHFVETDGKFEAIMMSLRTIYGLDIQKWNETYNGNFMEMYKKTIDKYSDTYLVLDENRLKCTEKGMEILNNILVDFL